MAKKKREGRFLNGKETALYGMGGVAGTMGDTLKGTFGLAFLSDIAGVPVAVAGAIMMAMTIWDAINDPNVGRLTDRTQSRWGKYRPHLVVSGFGMALMLVAMFWVPPLTGAARIAYYTIILALYSVFFTQFVVPLQALNTMVTPNSDERNTLLSARQFTGFISGGIVSIIALPMVSAIGGSDDSVTGWVVVAAFVGVISIITAFMCAAGVKKRDYKGSLATPPPLRVKDQINVIFKNRAVMCLCGAFGMVSLNYALSNAILVYYANNVVRNSGLVSIQATTTLLMSLVVIPLIPTLLRRFGKLPVAVTGLAINLVPAVGLIFLGADAGMAAVVVIHTIGAMGFCLANMTCLSLVPDVVDYTELQYDSVQPGFISAFVNFFRKFFSSFSTFIIGFMLGMVGYDADAEPTAAVVSQILNIKIILPIIIALVGLLMLKLYPINGKKQREIQEKIAQKRADAQ